MWRRANQRLPLLLRHLWWLLRPMLVWLVSSLQICRRQRCLRGRVQVAVEIAGGVAGMLDQAQTRHGKGCGASWRGILSGSRLAGAAPPVFRSNSKITAYRKMILHASWKARPARAFKGM